MSSLLFFKQKTAYEMRISDWSSDVCSSDLAVGGGVRHRSVAALHLHAVPLREQLHVVTEIGQEDVLAELFERRAGVAWQPVGDDFLLAFHDGVIPDGVAGDATPAGCQIDGDNFSRLPPVATQLLARSEEHTSDLQYLMRISYAIFTLQKTNIL